MNLILLHPSDFIGETAARVTGRRFEHIRTVHQAAVGEVLRVGVFGGRMGTGAVQSIDREGLTFEVSLTEDPPDPLPVVLLLALPRPKCFRRVLQCVVTLGIKRLALFGAFRVEKSYWQSPWLGETEVREQVVLALEQARDTVPPVITTHPLFKPFVEDVVPELTAGGRRLVAHPTQGATCPAGLPGPLSLAIGPEGGFTDYELGHLRQLDFEPVTLGPRILRTEQAVPAFLGRLMEAET